MVTKREEAQRSSNEAVGLFTQSWSAPQLMSQQSDPEFKTLREQILPAVRRLHGFVSGYWLVPVGGIATAAVFFDSEDAARKAAEGMGVRPGASLAPGTEITSVEYIEVAGHA
jgi:hypothetical protein